MARSAFCLMFQFQSKEDRQRLIKLLIEDPFLFSLFLKTSQLQNCDDGSCHGVDVIATYGKMVSTFRHMNHQSAIYINQKLSIHM